MILCNTRIILGHVSSEVDRIVFVVNLRLVSEIGESD
jgi:hypothetical protein